MIKFGQSYKPGSVLDNHLSRLAIADMLKRPTYREASGQPPFNPYLGLAPDGVYTAGMSTIPPVSSYLTISTLPRALPVSAECFCCTFPIVTYAGRYPASLPCGARTFLIHMVDATACSTRNLYNRYQITEIEYVTIIAAIRTMTMIFANVCFFLFMF